MPEFQTICKADELPPGDSRAFRVGETMVAVFHEGDRYFALQDACPHAGASLARGYLEEGGVVRCRIHHWGFCLREGTCVDEDNPSHNAERFAVRVVDDKVQVAVDGVVTALWTRLPRKKIRRSRKLGLEGRLAGVRRETVKIGVHRFLRLARFIPNR